ncbi:MAG: Stringent starvation protein A [Candidatus Erwinia impunctatus]|nr:Stringent starvation protein A [Culicoides impunctatus]
MKLYIGTDSSWSIRALMCCEIAEIVSEIELIDLTSKEEQLRLKALSPTGLVPFLQHNEVVVYDSLSIVEYLNELAPGLVYPADQAERSLCRSLCAELHAGFHCVRSEMPFSTQKIVKKVSPSAQAAEELKRVSEIFSLSQGHFMWGSEPKAVDAFYAVMAHRLYSYGIEFSGRAEAYQHALIHWALLRRSLGKVSLSAAA